MTSFSGCLSKFQSTLSVRRATHVVDLGPVGVDISIHALRKESDTFPHDLTPSKRFQSTLSVRRATQAKTHIWRPQNISIHALRKESDWCDMLSKTFYQISIHALRKESDQDGAHNVKQAKEFQSTLSVRRATQMDGAIVRLVVISIHALRKESDRHVA